MTESEAIQILSDVLELLKRQLIHGRADSIDVRRELASLGVGLG